MIREFLASVARNESIGPVIGRTPVARDLLTRLVGGESIDDVVAVAAELSDAGYLVAIERACRPDAPVDAALAEHLALVDAIAASDLSGVAEVAVLPESFGPRADDDLRVLAQRAQAAGVPLMLGNGPGTDAERAVALHAGLAEQGLAVGITVPAAVRASESLCASLPGRVRLVKGGRGGRAPMAYSQPIEIDKSFVRCAKALMRGSSDPSFSTHDARLISIVESLANRAERSESSYEFTMFMGRAESEQARLLAEGRQVRVYVPYGPEWFDRLVAGLAEQPSSIAAAVRSLLPGA
jgi:proline dehydrogenase